MPRCEVSEESSNSKKMQRNSMHHASLPSHTMRRVGTPISLSGLELEIVRLLGKQNVLEVVTTNGYSAAEYSSAKKSG